VSTQRKSVSCGAFILVHVVVVVTNASAVTREYRKRDFPVFGGSKMRHKTTTTLVKFSHLNAPLQRPYRLVLHRQLSQRTLYSAFALSTRRCLLFSVVVLRHDDDDFAKEKMRKKSKRRREKRMTLLMNTTTLESHYTSPSSSLSSPSPSSSEIAVSVDILSTSSVV